MITYCHRLLHTTTTIEEGDDIVAVIFFATKRPKKVTIIVVAFFFIAKPSKNDAHPSKLLVRLKMSLSGSNNRII